MNECVIINEKKLFVILENFLTHHIWYNFYGNYVVTIKCTIYINTTYINNDINIYK